MHGRYSGTWPSWQFQQTASKVQMMRLKQNADAYHCEIIFILFRERQHYIIYCIFSPSDFQNCCWSKHLKSEVHILEYHPLHPILGLSLRNNWHSTLMTFKRPSNRYITFWKTIAIFYIQFWKCDRNMIIKNCQLSSMTNVTGSIVVDTNTKSLLFMYIQRIHELELHCNKETSDEDG